MGGKRKQKNNLFTGDKDYLKANYPIRKDAAKFFLDTLQDHPKVKCLVACPSMSPENRHHKIEGADGDNTSILTKGMTS